MLIKSGAFPNISLRVHNFFYNFYYNFCHFYYNYYYGQFPQMEQVALLLQPAAPSPRNPAGTVITPLRPKPLMITIAVVTISISFLHVIKIKEVLVLPLIYPSSWHNHH